MQANALWAGNDYAYSPEGSSRSFTYSATRVRVIRVFKEKDRYYAERATSYAEVQMLNDDGTPKTASDGKELRARKVRARDIISHWEEYADERNERQEKMRQRREEQQREAAKLAEEAEIIMQALESVGIPRIAVSFSPYETAFIKLRREEMLAWAIENSASVK
jgi:hypothetical protein